MIENSILRISIQIYCNCLYIAFYVFLNNIRRVQFQIYFKKLADRRLIPIEEEPIEVLYNNRHTRYLDTLPTLPVG